MKKLIATLSALFVPFILFVFVIALNESDFKLARDDDKQVNFDVEKRPPIKKPTPKPKKKPKPKQRNQALPSVKPSNIGNSLAGDGLSFGVPQFDETEFAEFKDDGLLDSKNNDAMDKNSVDIPPKPRKRSPIVYPELARKQGISGYVLMNVLIDEGGNVDDVELLESKPKEVFDLQAESTIRKWKFEPASYNGQKVKVWAMQKITFKLD